MLGHELTHIRNGDVRMMVVAVIIAGVVSFFAELVFRLWFYNGFSFRGSRSSDDRARRRRRHRHSHRHRASRRRLCAVASSFVSRCRARANILADAGSVELTKNPDAMISALRKIEGRGELPGATSAVMEMCVDNPREGFGELFDTHPSVENRVAALVKFAGGHDPGPIALPPQADDADVEAAREPARGRTMERRRQAHRTADRGGPWGSSTDPPTEAAPPGRTWTRPPKHRPVRGPATARRWGPRRLTSRKADIINHNRLQIRPNAAFAARQHTLRLPNSVPAV